MCSGAQEMELVNLLREFFTIVGLICEQSIHLHNFFVLFQQFVGEFVQNFQE